MVCKRWRQYIDVPVSAEYRGECNSVCQVVGCYADTDAYQNLDPEQNRHAYQNLDPEQNYHAYQNLDPDQDRHAYQICHPYKNRYPHEHCHPYQNPDQNRHEHENRHADCHTEYHPDGDAYCHSRTIAWWEATFSAPLGADASVREMFIYFVFQLPVPITKKLCHMCDRVFSFDYPLAQRLFRQTRVCWSPRSSKMSRRWEYRD